MNYTDPLEDMQPCTATPCNNDTVNALESDSIGGIGCGDCTTEMVDPLETIVKTQQQVFVISTVEPEIIAFNTGGDTVIEWTTTRKTNFGTFPTIEVWALGDGSNYYLANIPIDAIGNPPTQFIIRNAGGVGYIKIS